MDGLSSSSPLWRSTIHGKGRHHLFFNLIMNMNMSINMNMNRGRSYASIPSFPFSLMGSSPLSLLIWTSSHSGPCGEKGRDRGVIRNRNRTRTRTRTRKQVTSALHPARAKPDPEPEPESESESCKKGDIASRRRGNVSTSQSYSASRPSRPNKYILSIITRLQSIKTTQDALGLGREIAAEKDEVNGMDTLKAFHKLMLSVKSLLVPKDKRVGAMLELLEIMRNGGIAVNSYHLSTVISTCTNGGAIVEAKKVFEEEWTRGNKDVLNSYICNNLLHGYCSSGLPKCVYSLLELMDNEGVKRDVVTYNTLLEFEQTPERASILFEELKDRGIDPNERTYSAAMRCFGRAGDLAMVRQLWAAMCSTRICLSLYAFNTFLDAFANIGDVMRCKEIVEEMKLSSFSPDRETYNTLLKAYARSRDGEGAVGVLRSMSRAGINPCMISYNTTMDACIRSGNIFRAFILSKELDLHGLKPNETTFSILLRAAGLLHDSRLVQKFLHQMQKTGIQHNEVTYRCAVYAFVNCGEGGEALKVLEEMDVHGYAPAMAVSEILVKSVDSALVRECLKEAEAGNLHQFLLHLSKSGLKLASETGGSIIRKMVYLHGVELALGTAEVLIEAGIVPLGLNTWKSLIGALEDQAHSNPSEAVAYVERILEMMKLESCSPDRSFMESAISLYIKVGDASKAVGIYETMQNLNLLGDKENERSSLSERLLLDTVDVALLSAIADESLMLQDMAEAGSGLELGKSTIMQGLAEAGIKIKPKAMASVIQKICYETTNTTLARSLKLRKPILNAKKGQRVQMRRVQRLERAMNLVETAKILFGVEVNNFVYKDLMEACIKLKQEWRVEILWKKMRLEGISPDISMWLLRINALAHHGNVKGRVDDLLTEAAKDGLELNTCLLRSLRKALLKVNDKYGAFYVKGILLSSKRASARAG